MMLYLAEANVDARKHSEYERLDEGHQQLETVEEDAQQDAYHRHGAVADTGHTDGCQEDDAQYTEQGGVTCQDVGEETDGEREWLGKDTDELDNCHNGSQPSGELGVPEDLLPVGLGAKDVYDEERKQGEAQGDGDVTRQVG